MNFRYEGYLLIHRQEYGLSYWQLLFKEQSVFYYAEFFHIVAAALVYELFQVELKENAWMLVASTNYKQTGVLKGKLPLAIINTLLFFITDYVSLAVIGKLIGVPAKFEFAMFMKSFIAQFSTGVMIVTFYILFVCLVKKISYLIPVSFVFMVLNVSLYYTDNVKFLVQYPFTYISYAFRATGLETVLIVMISIVLMILFSIIARKCLTKDCDIS